MVTLTQKERLASLEAQHQAHAREHRLVERMWSARLDAIDTRLRGIEQVLQSWRFSESGHEDLRSWRGVSKRDASVFGGSIALATALWWLVDLLRTAVGG